MKNDYARPRPRSLIAVFIDGTMNGAIPPEKEGRSNVRRLFEELVSCLDTASLYLPGVGCEAVAEMDSNSAADDGIANAVQIFLRTEKLLGIDFFGGLFGKYFGAGLTARVLAAYAFICAARKQYPDARLCIVGFSRGAYACCVLAHFMERAGLVVAKDALGLHLDTIRQAWTYDDRKLEEMILSGKSISWQLPKDAESISVDFLGCWDTVCAMGAPEEGLNLDVFPSGLSSVIDGLCALVHRRVKIWNPRFIHLFVPPNVVKARHALALHEYRVSFEALLWTPSGERDQLFPADIVQMWFPGSHADVGGGYVETERSHASSGHSLRWIKKEMLPNQWSSCESLVNFWLIHDSSSGKFEKMVPRIRQSLTRMTAEQLPTIEMSEWLQLGLREGPEVGMCEESGWPTTRANLVAFRPEIAKLHEEVHALARLTWLRGGLARAAAKNTNGLIPTAYADPSSIEALAALSASASGFIRDLNSAGLAAMVTDRALSARMARLCCYHLILTGEGFAIFEAALRAMKSTEGASAKVAGRRVLSKVLFDPMAFVLGSEFKAIFRNNLAIELLIN